MSPLLKNLLIALAFALVLWFGYRVFFSDGSAPLAPDSVTASEAARESQLLLRQVRQLREIELASELFSDGRFRVLVDFRREVTEEPVGRQNPFAPL